MAAKLNPSGSRSALVACAVAAWAVVGSEGAGLAADGSAVWSEDFESPIALEDWFADPGAWSLGAPTSGPGSSRSPVNAAVTVLDGAYGAAGESRLVGPPIRLPEVAGRQHFELRYWEWFAYGELDRGTVQVAVYDESIRSWGEWTDTEDVVSGRSSSWNQAVIDLTTHAGRSVRFGFLHSAERNSSNEPSEADGWYLDDLEIWLGEPQFTAAEGFEAGWGGWSASNGIWTVGEDDRAFEGRHSATTIPDADRPVGQRSRWISPVIELPEVRADEQVQLRYWEQFEYGDPDRGSVNISLYNASARSWGPWVGVGHEVHGQSGGWNRALIDLTAYAGRQVRLGFLYETERESSEGAGWALDEIEIWRGRSELPRREGFESGWGGWGVENGVWQLERTDDAPAGEFVAATIAHGDYLARQDSRLVSPPVRLPEVEGEVEVQLRYWEYFDYDPYDQGLLEVAVFDEAAGVWSDWLTTEHRVQDRCGVWSRAQVDLTGYAGRRVRFGFRHEAARNQADTPSERTGWRLDELEIWSGVGLLPNPETFARGWGDWFASSGVWEIETDPSGTPALATTVANGADYPYGQDSRLTSPAIRLPGLSGLRSILLKFRESFSYADLDYGRVEVTVYDPTRRVWGPWLDAGYRVEGESGGWRGSEVDLSAYSGRRIRVGFYHSAAREQLWILSESSGWRIDDVAVEANVLTAVNGQDIAAFTAQPVYAPEEELYTLRFATSLPGMRFALGPDAPAGARIDPELGILAWTPAECDGPGTNRFAVFVDDPNNPLSPLDSATLTVVTPELNHPPIIDPLPDVILEPSATVVVQVRAWDPDCPGRQQLQYTLIGGAPVGASIHPSTGEFRWNPASWQLDRQHTITIRVTDDGLLPRSATVTFVAYPAVTVGPGLSVTQLVDQGAARLALRGLDPESAYAIQASSDLTPGSWKTVLEGIVPGPLGDWTGLVPTDNQRYRFYRLIRP